MSLSPPTGERLEAYRICQERGHVASGLVLTSSPPWRECKHCGTAYRIEESVVELRSPEDSNEMG